MKSQPSAVKDNTSVNLASESSITRRSAFLPENLISILPMGGFAIGFLNSAFNQNQAWGSYRQALGGVLIALLIAPPVYRHIASHSSKRSPSHALLATLLGIGLPYVGLLLSKRMDAYAALSGAGAGIITATAFTAAVGLRLALIPTLLASLSVVIAAGLLPTTSEARDPLFLIVSTGFSGALGWLIHRAALWSADHQRLPQRPHDWLEVMTGAPIRAATAPPVVTDTDGAMESATAHAADQALELPVTTAQPTVLERWRLYIAAHPSKFGDCTLEMLAAKALRLTPAQARVVRALAGLMARRETSSLRKRLATQLSLSEETIKSHVDKIYGRYNASSLPQDRKMQLIVVIAAQHGLLEMDERLSPDVSPD